MGEKERDSCVYDGLMEIETKKWSKQAALNEDTIKLKGIERTKKLD